MEFQETILKIEAAVQELFAESKASAKIYTKFNMSGATMGRFLEKHNHPSVKEMLIEARMGHAKHLLSQDMVNVHGIHDKVGYSSRGSFERRFKDYTGMSPVGYRKSIIYSDAEQEHETYPRRINEVTQNELRKYLIKHFREPELNMARVQDAFNLSKEEVQEIMKIVYDCTFEERLLVMRLEEATKLLLKTKPTPQQIATECGFVSYQYFVVQFTKRYTVGPKQYRKLKLINAI